MSVNNDAVLSYPSILVSLSLSLSSLHASGSLLASRRLWTSGGINPWRRQSWCSLLAIWRIWLLYPGEGKQDSLFYDSRILEITRLGPRGPEGSTLPPLPLSSASPTFWFSFFLEQKEKVTRMREGGQAISSFSWETMVTHPLSHWHLPQEAKNFESLSAQNWNALRPEKGVSVPQLGQNRS